MSERLPDEELVEFVLQSLIDELTDEDVEVIRLRWLESAEFRAELRRDMTGVRWERLVDRLRLTEKELALPDEEPSTSSGFLKVVLGLILILAIAAAVGWPQLEPWLVDMGIIQVAEDDPEAGDDNPPDSADPDDPNGSDEREGSDQGNSNTQDTNTQDSQSTNSDDQTDSNATTDNANDNDTPENQTNDSPNGTEENDPDNSEPNTRENSSTATDDPNANNPANADNSEPPPEPRPWDEAVANNKPDVFEQIAFGSFDPTKHIPKVEDLLVWFSEAEDKSKIQPTQSSLGQSAMLTGLHRLEAPLTPDNVVAVVAGKIQSTTDTSVF